MERRYDIAKSEYETEDDNGRHLLVYAYFGLAIYFGQCLEEISLYPTKSLGILG